MSAARPRSRDVLVARLIVDINPAGQLVMHDLFRQVAIPSSSMQGERAGPARRQGSCRAASRRQARY